MAIAGEALADWQLRSYRSQPLHGGDGHGRICDFGLWGWSRHPDSFSEWLGWCAYPLFAIYPFGGYDWGWLTLSAPALMYWPLVHVSGIPPSEQQMLRSRGAAFRRIRLASARSFRSRLGQDEVGKVAAWFCRAPGPGDGFQ